MRRALRAQDYACFTAVAGMDLRTNGRIKPPEAFLRKGPLLNLRMATGEMSARELNDRLHTSPLRVRYPETWRMARFFRAALHEVRDAVD